MRAVSCTTALTRRSAQRVLRPSTGSRSMRVRCVLEHRCRLVYALGTPFLRGRMLQHKAFLRCPFAECTSVHARSADGLRLAV
jgi:hypothetical protein